MTIFKSTIFVLIFICFSLGSVFADSFDGYHNEFSYTFNRDKSAKNNFIFDNEGVEVIYFFNYKCPYSYDLHNYISSWKEIQGDSVKFYNIPTSIGNHGYSVELFLLAKHFGLSFDEEILIYDNFLKKINEGKDIELIYAELFGVDQVIIEEIIQSLDFLEKKEYIGDLTSNYNVSGTPYTIINTKNYRYEIKNQKGFEPINYILSINYAIKNYFKKS